MKLDAPRTFWGRKKKEHQRRIWLFTVSSLFSAGAGIYAIYFAAILTSTSLSCFTIGSQFADIGISRNEDELEAFGFKTSEVSIQGGKRMSRLDREGGEVSVHPDFWG